MSRRTISALFPLLFALTCFDLFAADQDKRGASQAWRDGVVDTPDLALHYRVIGDRGPFIVVLAGGPGGSVRMMDPLCEHLKHNYRCVLLEQRGTDRSVLKDYNEKTTAFEAYISDIEELHKHLGSRRITVLGNSWGMTLALAYAAAHPQNVQAVATLGSGGLKVEHFRIFRNNRQIRTSEAQEQRIRELHAKGLPIDQLVVDISRVMMSTYIYKREAAAKAAASLQTGDINHRIGEFTERTLAHTDSLVLDRLSRITAPVLVIQGRQDLAPEEVAFTVAERVRNAEILLIDECGHIPWLDQPEATFRKLDQFLSKYVPVRETSTTP